MAMLEMISNRHARLEPNRFVMLQGTNNQGSGPSQIQQNIKTEKTKKKNDVDNPHIKMCISSPVSQCAWKMSSIKSQTKQVDGR